MQILISTALMRKIFFSVLLTLVIFIGSYRIASAHQPVIPSVFPVAIDNPEVSKAFYAATAESPDVYTIFSNRQFNLYVNILVPDIAGQSKDLFVTIVQNGKKDKQIAYLDGTKFVWTKFFEEFGHDNYLKGPEFKIQATAGSYEIKVSSKTPGIKYSLAVGETESFKFPESLSMISIIPMLKTNFFSKSPADFILSPIGGGYAAVLIILSFVFGFIFSLIMRKFAKGKVRRRVMNIGSSDRIFRFSLGAVLFLIAITTTWSWILIFAAGFCFFEAIFSWCGVYALMGKNTCPV